MATSYFLRRHTGYLDPLLDTTSRDTFDIGLGYRVHQSLFRASAKLQKSVWEICTPTELRYSQHQRPATNVPMAIAISVSMVFPFTINSAITGFTDRLSLRASDSERTPRGHLSQSLLLNHAMGSTVTLVTVFSFRLNGHFNLFNLKRGDLSFYLSPCTTSVDSNSAPSGE